MELSALTSKLRKTIIFNALDAFKSFLGASIDSIPSQDTIAAGKAAKRGNMNKASTNDDSGGMYGTAGITDANKPSDFKGVYNNLEPGAGAPAMSSEMGTTETGSTVGAPSIGTLDLQHESGVGIGDGGRPQHEPVAAFQHQLGGVNCRRRGAALPSHAGQSGDRPRCRRHADV